MRNDQEAAVLMTEANKESDTDDVGEKIDQKVITRSVSHSLVPSS